MKTTAKVSGMLVVLLALAHGRGADAPPPAKPAPAAKRAEPPRELTLSLSSKAAMKLVLVPAGKFVMGSPKEERDRLDSEGPRRDVTLSKAFYLGIYHVTQEQYEAVTGTNPSKFKEATRPVEQVSWNDAVAFCRKASAKTGKRFRLPTEAEWEYACRAGTDTCFSFGDDDRALGEHAWFSDNSGKSTHPVGQKKPNAWGIYDMHGEVWQWCSDWYADSYTGAASKDPQGPKSGKNHVCRGGSWLGSPSMCRSAFRTSTAPGNRIAYFGFRVVVEVP